MFSSTWYLVPLMVKFSLEHTQPILNSVDKPILYILHSDILIAGM